MHAGAVVALAVLALLLVAALMTVFSARWRRRAPRLAGLAVGGLAALYLVARGIAEFWTVDYADPASYQHSWGGPSLAGVFAVHSGPALVILVMVALRAGRRIRRRPHRPGDA